MDKVKISKLLDGFYGYPKTIICDSLYKYNKASLQNKHYFIKTPDGVRSNTISFSKGKQLLIDRGALRSFPLIVQEEVSPKLDDGYKVDYRAWCLVVSKTPHLYKKCMVKKCHTKFSRLDPEGLFTNGLRDGRATALIDTPNEFDNDIDKLEGIIKNVDLFKRILKLADVVVTQVLSSPDLERELKRVNNSPHNLFASGIWNDDMKKVIQHYIGFQEKEIREIKDLI